jgi:hypothetical protein
VRHWKTADGWISLEISLGSGFIAGLLTGTSSNV